MPVERPLQGRRVGLLEARKRRELSALVARLGGVPVCAPALREAPTDVDVTPPLADVTAGRFDVGVVMTAAAITALCDAADRLRVLPALREALARMTLACRGPKPQLALRQLGVRPAFVTVPPHTSGELIDALTGAPLKGRSVLVLHYGEWNDSLGTALRQMDATVTDACL
jgi:uroporphyrinogen-III synthase